MIEEYYGRVYIFRFNLPLPVKYLHIHFRQKRKTAIENFILIATTCPVSIYRQSKLLC